MKLKGIIKIVYQRAFYSNCCSMWRVKKDLVAIGTIMGCCKFELKCEANDRSPCWLSEQEFVEVGVDSCLATAKVKEVRILDRDVQLPLNLHGLNSPRQRFLTRRSVFISKLLINDFTSLWRLSIPSILTSTNKSGEIIFSNGTIKNSTVRRISEIFYVPIREK